MCFKSLYHCLLQPCHHPWRYKRRLVLTLDIFSIPDCIVDRCSICIVRLFTVDFQIVGRINWRHAFLSYGHAGKSWANR